MTFDPIEFKKHFPLFSQPENSRLVYLDNAATTQKPQCVIDAISNFYITANGNAGRSSHRLARSATAMLASTRHKAAIFLGANSSDEVVFTSGATESINIIAHAFQKKLLAQDEIVLSIAEHHANVVPWQELANQTGARLIFLSENCSDIFDKVSEKTKVLTLAAASNTLGQKIDLDVLVEIKNSYPDLLIVLDASQWAVHVPIVVKSWPCDFLVCSAHKFYGPTGIGLLYGRGNKLRRLSPYKFGGEMISNVTLYDSDYVSGPERFEAGTSPLSAIAGLNACFDFWEAQNRLAMHDYEQKLTVLLHQCLDTLCCQYPGITLLTRADNNIGIAMLTSSSYSLADIALWLDEQDIAVRVGQHCAQPLWHSRGVDGALRISLAAYNTPSDVACLVDALQGCFDSFISSDAAGNHRNNSGDDKAIVFPVDYVSLNWQALLQTQSWQQRYKALMHWGKCIVPTVSIRRDSNLIKGCESALWLSHSLSDGRHYFLVDSDSVVIKGLAALILCRVNAKASVDILAVDFDQYFSILGLQKHLSPSRLNGIHALLKTIRTYC